MFGMERCKVYLRSAAQCVIWNVRSLTTEKLDVVTAEMEKCVSASTDQGKIMTMSGPTFYFSGKKHIRREVELAS